jgi:hypothetical protein
MRIPTSGLDRLSRRPAGLSTRAVILFFAASALGALLIFALASPGRAPAGGPAPNTLMRIEPPSQTVPAGTDVVVDVRVDDVANMAAYEFQIDYFGSTLGFVSATNSSFLGSSGREVTCLNPQLDVGKVRFGCLTTGAQAGVSGSGLLATVRFSTSCSGPSPLRLGLAGLSDPLGSGLPTRSQGANSTVTGGPVCPTPTPTPRPTATPTRTPAGRAGDANCDGTVNAIDAALDLQFSAGLTHSLPCEDNADVNGDGRINAIDAALTLQFVAGLLSRL